MIRDFLGDIVRDRRLADLLHRDDRPPSPRGDDELRARIVRAAGARLRQLSERPRAWWEWTALWAHLLVPLGLAASLAAGVLLLRDTPSAESTPTETTSPSATTAAPVTLRGLMFGVATGSTTAPDIADALVAQASDEWLFTRAMRY